MSSDAQVLETIQQAFASSPRPRHFTNYTHCSECAEHDEVLRSRDVQTLRIEDVGNPGWDPICFISPEGFAYYVPALARLALAQPVEPHGWDTEFKPGFRLQTEHVVAMLRGLPSEIPDLREAMRSMHLVHRIFTPEAAASS